MTDATCLTPEIAFRPIYDVEKSYLENLNQGPLFDEPYPERIFPDKREWIDCLGFQAASPIGVPAGPLLNSRWISAASKLGFDILTYKTIRSKKWLGHPVPNVLFVTIEQEEYATSLSHTPDDVSTIAITNSFGNPSMNPEYLQYDIEASRNLLNEGQVLIVSVFGSADEPTLLREDFVRAACLAKDAGAHIIEANFSCPNVSSSQGSSLYADKEMATSIASAIVRAIHPTPLVIKVGYIENPKELKELLLSLARVGVRGVCGINTLPMEVKSPEGIYPLGPHRKTSGICGHPIRPYACDFISKASQIIDAENLDLTLLGCGGVTLAEHFDQFLEKGAQIAMSASGMMWDPYLALRWHERRNHE